MVDGIITAKVLRLDAAATAKRSLLLKKHANFGFGKESAQDAGGKKTQVLNKGGSPPQRAAQPSRPTNSPASSASNTGTQAPAPAAPSPSPSQAPAPAPRPPTPPPPQPQPQQQQQEFDFFATDSSSPATTSTATRASPAASSSFGSPMHGIDIDDGPSSGPSPAAAAAVEEPNREELVAKRDAEIKDRVDSALQFKKEVRARIDIVCVSSYSLLGLMFHVVFLSIYIAA
jgi:hypothetical protein